MEEILTGLSRDATSSPSKAIHEACSSATDELLLCRNGTRGPAPYQLRARCFLPLRLALESRSSKLAVQAVSGLQKLISDERFRSNGGEDADNQLPVQFINAVISTPSLSDEVQVEIMKLLLIITCSASCEVHGEYLIKIAEICMDTYNRSHQSSTKTACRATLTQMLSSICHRLQDSITRGESAKPFLSGERITKLSLITGYSKVLSQDVVVLLKHFCFRLTSGTSGSVQTVHAVPLHLEAIFVMLSSLPATLQEDRDFLNAIWQLLCPALIQLLGSPTSDITRTKSPSGYPEDINRTGRGSGSFAKASPAVGPIARTVYNIAAELLRLVGPLAAMRPVLESLFHRIILYPPPNQRCEALKALKEVLASPQRLLDAAGPTIIDKENPPSPDSPTEQKKSELDLLRLLMDGIVESAHCPDNIVASCSVACVVALLGSLEDLSLGRGLSDEHVDFLSKVKEAPDLEELYHDKVKYENAASARDVPTFTVADVTFDGEDRFLIGERSSEGDINSLTERFERNGQSWGPQEDGVEGKEEEFDIPPLQPKSVHFAAEDEITMFEAHENEKSRTSRASSPQRNGSVHRSNLPRRLGASPQPGTRATVRRSSSLDGKSRLKPNIVQRRNSLEDARSKQRTRNSGDPTRIQNLNSSRDLKYQSENSSTARSFSDIDVPNKKSQTWDFPVLPLRKSNSWTKLSSVDTNDSQSSDSASTVSLQCGETDPVTNGKSRGRISSDCSWNETKKNGIGNLLDEESKHADPMVRKASDAAIKVHKVESKANKLEAKEKAERTSPTKNSRPNIRRTRSASEFDRKQLEAKASKQRGSLAKSQSLDEPNEVKQKRTIASQVRINGIYVNRKGPLRSAKGTTSSDEQRNVVEVKKSVQDNEKEGARNFARCLLGILPSVLSLTDSMAVDESLQQFSSDVCEAVTCMALQRKNVPNFGTLRGSSDLVDEESGEGATSDPHYPILNADGVYVTVYATLTLNLKLLKNNYYQKKIIDPPLAQKDFVSSILESGVAVGLSSVWLGELYRLVTTYNILGKAGYALDNATTNRALIGLLSTNALGPERETKDNALLRQLLPDNLLPAKREGIKFARRVLLTTWDSVLEILSLPLETSVTGGTNGMSLMLGGESKRDHNRERDTICLSLDGLRRAARLCCSLGIQMRCEMVLAQLANASCGSDGLGTNRRKHPGNHGPFNLHAAHVLSMDGLLAVGVELGIHAPKCWQHVFRCCMYISELERTHFHVGVVDPMRPSPPNSLRVTSEFSPMSETSSISDCFSGGEVSPNVIDISRKGIRENDAEPTAANSGLLSLADASRAIYALSAAVDRLFEHAASTLTWEGLLSFLRALVSASEAQLFPRSAEIFSSLCSSPPADMAGHLPTYSGTLHLYRLADVMLRSARNANRPLLHLMKAWYIVSPHLVEAASHKDQHVSNLAMTSLHDIITEMLSSRSELPHFWFHEALFKPFHQIASSEGCTEEKQEQLLSTVCSLVDPYVSSVKSGWRSVFAFVMAIRISDRVSLEALQTDHRLTQILGMFSSFLGNKNPAVFASAAVPCIHALLRFVNSSGYDDINDDGSRSDIDSASNISDITMVEMSLPALEFLSNFSKKLASVYIMPSSLVFHGSHAVGLATLDKAHLLPSSPAPSPNSSPVKQNNSASSDLQMISRDSAQSMVAIDDTGILRVWFLLLEGLTNAVAQCPRRFQPQTLEILFDILRSITTVPGPNFSVYTVSHLLLPMLQAWVERGNRDRSYWEGTAANFKHACGLATELIVEELGQFLSVEGAAECVPGVIKQILDLLIECVKQPVERIARLGCSCLRHLLLAGGPVFTEDLWHIVCQGLKEAVQTTLSNMKQMVTCFQPGSYNVSGDEGMTVRVVARRDSTASDLIRLQQVAEQVLLLDNQMESCSLHTTEMKEPSSDEEDQRSYVFVLSTVQSKEKPEAAQRIPLRGLLVSLLSHQLLLKTLGSILLDQHENSFSQNGLVPSSPAVSADSVATEGSEASLPGLLSYLSPANISVLFDCLMESHMVAYEFNARPGLRFLIQKLSRLEAPANLLRQSADAFTCYLQTLFEICMHGGDHFSSSHIKRILTGERGNNHETEETTNANMEASPSRHNDLLKGDRNVDWIIRRLNEACDQLSSVYVRLYNQYTSDSQEGELDKSFSISASYSPARDLPNWSQGGDDSLNSPLPRSKKALSPEHRGDTGHREGKAKHKLEDELRMIEHEKQLIRRKEDELLQLGIWTHLVTTMLELLLGLPTLQFKAVLPAVFSTVTGLIATGTEPKVRQLVCDIIKRVGSIYGIV